MQHNKKQSIKILKTKIFLLTSYLSLFLATANAAEPIKVPEKLRTFCVRINEKIQHNWNRPKGDHRGKECFFKITIEEGGELQKIEILKCDDPELKITGLKAIADSLPFPQYNEHLEIVVKFNGE